MPMWLRSSPAIVLIACGANVDSEPSMAARPTTPSSTPQPSGPSDAELQLDAATQDAGGQMSETFCGRQPQNHRPASQECDRERGPGSLSRTVDNPACRVDSDCTAGENGRCLNAQFQAVPMCSYDLCFSDVTCARGGPCSCAPPKSTGNNICLEGNCKTDTDCGPNGFCSPSFGMCGRYSGVTAYYCHSCDDECVEDSDCDRPDAYCAYEPSRARWRCSTFSCVD
jgi:hypothetical protein